ncbi:hypothetical protein ACERCG_07600 [Mannheimia sp. E30BD]|uniref:hypothetical protein n=1 Tax=Mannheimia sp. E30BD TaxID=3278708 RepID=UPI00359DEDDC
MRLIILSLSLLILGGCYLANGSPQATTYFLKNSRQISYDDMKYCTNKVYKSLGIRFLSLSNKGKSEGLANMKYNNPSEYQEYSKYLDYAEPIISQCYFELGYKFTAPYYWCIAESNMETCKINQKYR